jgi:hypothetical protein
MYWTTEDDRARLFDEIIPEKTRGWSRQRVMLYLHGGLNDERAVAQRIVAFRDVFLANEIYPIHVMWESGVWESLSGLVQDLFTDVDDRAGAVGDWLREMREGLIEAKDRSLELTAALPGGALWREMKENARLASRHPDQKGGMQLVVQYARRALQTLTDAQRAKWELHVVAHSAGSIFVAEALRHLVALGVRWKTLQFMAPAITVEEFKRLMLPAIKSGACPSPTSYILSNDGELDDEVGPYGKSLLYLVSNAFEGRRETPLLGMQRFVTGPAADRDVAKLFARSVDGRPALVIAGAHGDPDSENDDGAHSRSESDTHGGFDNDPATLNSILFRILDGKPAREFEVRHLQFDQDSAGASRAGRRRAAATAWGMVGIETR